MRNLAPCCLNLLAVAAVLIWSVVTDGARAQQVDVQPQASERPTNDGNQNDENDRDEEPQTVQAQMQAVKRELRGAKFDPDKTAPIRDGNHRFSAQGAELRPAAAAQHRDAAARLFLRRRLPGHDLPLLLGRQRHRRHGPRRISTNCSPPKKPKTASKTVWR